MAASLLRRARTTYVRAWASSRFRHREPRLLTDRAELQVAYYEGGACYSSSSAVSGFRDASSLSSSEAEEGRGAGEFRWRRAASAPWTGRCTTASANLCSPSASLTSLGSDISGVVVKVGPGVATFVPGDKVVCCLGRY